MALSYVKIQTVDNASPGKLIDVQITIHNISATTIVAMPVLRVNGSWADEGTEKVIVSKTETTWTLNFIMPNVDAFVRVEDWCENAEPWHLDDVEEKIIDVLTQESEFDNLVVTISKGE